MFSVLRLSCHRLAACISATLVVTAMLLSAPALRAQSSDTAGLEIYVHDPSGATLADAKIHVVQQQQNVARDGITDKSGHYRFSALPPGDYVITITKDGFAEMVESGISLSVGQAPTLPVSMKVASADTQVSVTTETPIIDTDRSSIGQTISNIEIENLPSDGRNFVDFALTVPGISENAGSGQGSGISSNGGRQRSNSVLIDGVENNGALNGTVRQTISLDAVSQFQVITNQFLPEYGEASGTLINLITKTGTEKYHGNAYYIVRNPALNAKGTCFATGATNAGAFNCPSVGFTQNDAGAVFGGPLWKDKTVFFSSFEYLGRNSSLGNNLSGANAAIINSSLALGRLVGTSVNNVVTGSTPTALAQTLASLRIDHTFNEKNTFTYRLLYAQYSNSNPSLDRDDGAYSDISNYGKDRLHAYSMMGEYTHVFTPALLNEFHVQFAPQHLTQLANASGPTVQISSISEFGTNPIFPTILDETHYEGIDSLTWSRGNHLMKFGGDFTYINAFTQYPSSFQGIFYFTNIGTLEQAQNPTAYATTAVPNFPDGTPRCPNYTTTPPASVSASNFACGNPYQFSQAFGVPSIHLPEKLLGVYWEDQWKVKPRISLNYGIRYDVDLQPQGYNLNASNSIEAPLPKGVPRDYNNFAPRIGFAISLDKSGHTVLRGGYGMFYDKIFLILARDALLPRLTLTLATSSTSSSSPNTYAQISTQYAAGAFPQSTTYPGFAATPQPPSITGMPAKLGIPVTHEANLYVDRQLNQNWSMEVGYVFVSGQHLLRANNSNLTPPIVNTTAAVTSQSAGRPTFGAGRIDPNFRNITEYGANGHSTYSGLRGSIIHRPSAGLTLRASWTWAKAVDDGSDFTSGGEPTNSYLPQGEKALSTQDMRNRLTASAVYRFPYRMKSRHNSAMRWVLGSWTGSAIFIGHSGTPENITTGSDSNGDTNSNDRPYTSSTYLLNGLNGGAITGRNSFRGPRSVTLAIRLQKDIRTYRSQRLTLSAEAFNALNQTIYTDANTTWGTNLVPNGLSGGSATYHPEYNLTSPLVWGKSGEVTSGVFGAFDGTALPRSVQLGIKYTF